MDYNEIVNQLNSCSSVAKGESLLQGIKKSDLQKISIKAGYKPLSSWNKEMLIQKILFFTIQTRLNAKAISEIKLK